MTQLYRIEEQFTNGWELIDETSKNLTKDQCKAKLQEHIAKGCNPNYLRVVPEV